MSIAVFMRIRELLLNLNRRLNIMKNKQIACRKIWIAIVLIISSCRAWEPSLEPAVFVENAHSVSTKRVAFSPSDAWLASTGYRGEIKIWSVPNLEHRLTFLKHGGTPKGLAWQNDTVLISGDDDGHIFRWDTTSGHVLGHQTAPAGITALIFMSRTNRIISGHYDGVLRSYDADTLTFLTDYDAEARISSVASTHDEDMIAVSCRNRRIILLNNRLEAPRHLTAPPTNAVEITFSPDGRQLAGGGWYKLFFWEISSGRINVVKSDHWGIAASLDYTPDGRYLATIGRITDSEIYLVDPQDGLFRHHLKRQDLCGTVVRISSDGRYLASGSDDAGLRLYDLTKLPNTGKRP